MRWVVFLLIAALAAPGTSAQELGGSSATPAGASSPATAQEEPAPDAARPADLPVSLDRIKKELGKSPALSLDVRNQPTFRIEVQERNRLQELLLTLDFSTGPTPAGGIYAAEMQRVMFPSVSNPLRQPFAAFNQPELLTILIQTIAGTYLAKKAVGAITDAEREAAERAAKEDLQRAIAEYCAGQPGDGTGIAICTDRTIAIR
jgi:hypothetical protein